MESKSYKYSNRFVVVIDNYENTIHFNEPITIKNSVTQSNFDLPIIKEFINNPKIHHILFYSPSHDKYMGIHCTVEEDLSICKMLREERKYFELSGEDFKVAKPFHAKDFVICLLKNNEILYGNSLP